LARSFGVLGQKTICGDLGFLVTAGMDETLKFESSRRGRQSFESGFQRWFQVGVRVVVRGRVSGRRTRSVHLRVMKPDRAKQVGFSWGLRVEPSDSWLGLLVYPIEEDVNDDLNGGT
jgi:hypothetical protein